MHATLRGLDHIHEITHHLVEANFDRKWLIGAIVEKYAP